jgi:hypothetical protein
MVFELKRPPCGTFRSMGERRSRRALRGLALALALTMGAGAAGCGSNAAPTGPPPITDADFAVCEGTPAIHFAPGIAVLSASGAYRVSLQAASTAQAGATTPVPTAAIGLGAFTVAVTLAAGDAGADAGMPAPDDLSMMAPPKTQAVPADPYMPIHGHGGSTVPTITAQGAGVYSVGNLDFFMGGYWDLYVELTPAGGTPDLVTFPICIPDD